MTLTFERDLNKPTR